MEPRFSIELLPSARRELEKLPRDGRRRLVSAIEELVSDPRPGGATLLSGTSRERISRIRVGGYRVLYQVEEQRLVVLVVRVADRREAYDPVVMKRLIGRLRRER